MKGYPKIVFLACILTLFPLIHDGMNSNFVFAQEGPGQTERDAMKRLDFITGEWEGEGWFQSGSDQRNTFSIYESFRFMMNGLVLWMEGISKVKLPNAEKEVISSHGLGILTYNPQNNEYSLWHYSPGEDTFSTRVDIDVDKKKAEYVIRDTNGIPIRRRFRIDENGVWIGTGERRQSNGTWLKYIEYTMRRVKN